MALKASKTRNKPHLDKPQRLELLESRIRTYSPHFNFNEVKRALAWSEANFKSTKIKTVDDQFSDPLLIVEELVKHAKADRETILASILYPSVRPLNGVGSDSAKLQEIEVQFGYNVRRLVKRTLRFRALNLPIEESKKNDSENLALFRLMALWAARDPRAILIRATQNVVKLALEVEKPGTHEPDALKKLITDANEIYAHLTYIAGYNGLRNKLMNLTYQLTHPNEYQQTTRLIASTVTRTEGELIKQTIADQISEKFQWILGVHFDVEFRAKSPASAYVKAMRKGQQVADLGDLWAARVILKMPAIEWPEGTNPDILNEDERLTALEAFSKKNFDVYGKLSRAFGRANIRTALYTNSQNGKKERLSYIQLRLAELGLNEPREKDPGRLADEIEDPGRMAWEKQEYPDIVDARFDDYIKRPKKSGYSALQDSFWIPISDKTWTPLIFDIEAFLNEKYDSISVARMPDMTIDGIKFHMRAPLSTLQLTQHEKRKILAGVAIKNPDFSDTVRQLDDLNDANAQVDLYLRALTALGMIDHRGEMLPDKTRPIEIECQVVDEIRHEINTYGPRAGHIYFKAKLGKHVTAVGDWFKSVATEFGGRHYRGQKHVYVTGPEGRVYDISDTPTVGGFLQAANITASEVHIVDNYSPRPTKDTYGVSTILPNGCTVIPV